MPTRYLTPGQKYSHKQAFTIWLRNGPNRAEWLDEQGFIGARSAKRCPIPG